MLEQWLTEKIEKQVLIRNIIDKEHFLNELQSINTIYLSAVPNLFLLCFFGKLQEFQGN